MIKITKKLKKNNFVAKDYPVWSKEEAKDLTYKHWQKCEEGELGISDDGFIAECIYKKKYKRGTEMTFPYGRQWLGHNRYLEFKPHYKSGNFNTVSTKPYSEIEANSKRAELAVDAYLAYKIAGESPDLNAIGKLYRPDQKEPHIAAKRLLKSKETKQMIKEKLQEILTDKGVDEGYVLDVMKDAIIVAKMKEDSGSMIRAAKELSIFLDMAPNKSSQTETIEMDISHQIANQYETQTKKLKATQKKELPSGETNSTEGQGK